MFLILVVPFEINFKKSIDYHTAAIGTNGKLVEK